MQCQNASFLTRALSSTQQWKLVMNLLNRSWLRHRTWNICVRCSPLMDGSASSWEVKGDKVGIRLNLGCGQSIVKDAINVDIYEYEFWQLSKKQGIEFLVADLNENWPWRDNSVEAIRAKDIFEHLPDQIHTMGEAYRVLQPGGMLHIWVPTTDSLAAFADPTHKSFWNVNTFYYFTDNKAKEWKVPIYAEKITQRFKLLAAKPFIYRDLPQSRGIYVQLQKPDLSAIMDEEGE